ncbi:Uncharacterised protein [Bordetella pertussis]|nr:Uncharacterised protein [Bordetella pertussis]CPM72241.1 Uncharacterised protein [Bordetella pertussis]CPO22945.1 Uncharacterised protein [Bordetella pertussis]
MPRLMPTPNTITAPHGMRVCTSFQVMTPKRGSISSTRPK